jgi:carbonic anhydrase
MASSAPVSASQAAKEEEDEAELSAKIAARLAAMRANQAARAAAAAKARKAAEARRKELVAAPAEPAPPVIKPYPGNQWSYEGETGPANWGRHPAWGACGKGSRQSPIDLRDGIKVDLEPITFDYKPSAFSVIDNGHTIQVNVGPGNTITLQNRSYELQQFHFHRPSEERINGKGFEMVVHLEHKDSEGKLAVVAVLLERGKAQNMIQTVWNNLPLEKNDTVSPSIVLNVADVLPARREYFTYMGSMTTPPCSEGVLWMVMKEPVQASPAQMALFSRLYPLNARPVQPGSGRVVKESN